MIYSVTDLREVRKEFRRLQNHSHEELQELVRRVCTDEAANYATQYTTGDMIKMIMLHNPDLNRDAVIAYFMGAG